MSLINSNPQKIQDGENPNYRIFPFPNHWLPYILLGLISFAIYFNSIWNENALDDGIIIQKNEFVLRGLRGIKGIMTKDSYYSFYRQMNAEDQLAGGRYRPLSVVTFAIEQQFIGTYPAGYFARATDTSRNGMVEQGEANWWIDGNGNNSIEESECVECWDQNKNFKRDTVRVQDKNGRWVAAYTNVPLPGGGVKDPKTGKMRDATIAVPVFEEDVNQDGNVNDKDCEVKGAMVRHTNNVLFYALSILIIFAMLKNHFFKNNHDLAFLATLLFAIHPIHTEVVSNVKSRDEILSMLFIGLTFIYSFKFKETKQYKHLITAGIMYFLSLLSKEYALTLMALVPMAFYLFLPPTEKTKTTVPSSAPVQRDGKGRIKPATSSAEANSYGKFNIGKFVTENSRPIIFAFGLVVTVFIMFKLAQKHKMFIPLAPLYIVGTLVAYSKDFKLKNSLSLMVVLAQFLVVYFAFRFASVTLETKVPDTEILNNPYLPIKDNPESLWATKIFVLLKYLGLLFYPHPLSSDYSFNTIAFRHFSDPEVLFSLVLHIGMTVAAVYLFLKRKPVAFAFLFYFANLAMVGNIVFDIGATMGERLVYHSSLGVAIGVAWLLTEGLGKVMNYSMAQKSLAVLATLVIVTAGSYKTWTRNYDWKNDITLFCHDVETVPNSVLVLGNAGARWIDKSEWPQNVFIKDSLVRKAKGYLTHALDLHPKYVNGYLNLGLAYYKLEDLDSSAITWKHAEELYPTNPYLSIYYGTLVPRLMAEAYQKGQAKNYDKAIHYLKLAVWLQPNNPETNYNLGGAFFSTGQVDSAQVYFQKALQLKPDHKQAAEGLNSCNLQKAQMQGQATTTIQMQQGIKP